MIDKALLSLRPNASWTLNGDSYNGIDWLDTTQSKPTEEEVLVEITKLQTSYAAAEYQRLRSASYPPLTDYLDGVVKGNQTQVQAYIDACLAVKAKHPKPSDQ